MAKGVIILCTRKKSGIWFIYTKLVLEIKVVDLVIVLMFIVLLEIL